MNPGLQLWVRRYHLPRLSPPWCLPVVPFAEWPPQTEAEALRKQRQEAARDADPPRLKPPWC